MAIDLYKLTYASIDENNKEIYTFTSKEPVFWSTSRGRENSFDIFTIDQDTGQLCFKDVPDHETIKK